MAGHSSLLYADYVNLSAFPAIHVFDTKKEGVDAREIQRKDALRAFARA